MGPKYFTAAMRGDGDDDDRWVVPQVIVADFSVKSAKVTFLRFLRRNGVATTAADLVVRATEIAVPHHNVGPHITRSPEALILTEVEELEPLPFEYTGAKHGDFARDPWEVA